MLIFLSLVRFTAVNFHVIQHNNHAKLPVKHAVFLAFNDIHDRQKDIISGFFLFLLIENHTKLKIS